MYIGVANAWVGWKETHIKESETIFLIRKRHERPSSRVIDSVDLLIEICWQKQRSIGCPQQHDPRIPCGFFCHLYVHELLLTEDRQQICIECRHTYPSRHLSSRIGTAHVHDFPFLSEQDVTMSLCCESSAIALIIPLVLSSLTKNPLF